MKDRNIMYDAPIEGGDIIIEPGFGGNELADLIADAEARQPAAPVLPDYIRSMCSIQELAELCAHVHNRAAELAHSQILPKTPMEQHMLQMVMAQQNALLVGLSAFAQR